MDSSLIVGLMSGTSLDGVDAVLVDLDEDGFPTLQSSHYQSYPEALRQQLLRLQTPQPNELHEAARVGNQLAQTYADAVTALLHRSRVAAAAVTAIGCHGQTVRHQPAAGYSLQLGNAALLAELTGIRVVADFRSRDIAAGGQGAPLVPAFHEALFRHPRRHRVIVNIGGIANLTDLKPSQATTGFDCGPGNVLLDGWVQRHLCQSHDAAGDWGRSGQILPELLQTLRHHRFFSQQPPKSCGREEFNLAWLDTILSGAEMPVDVQATLSAFTASTAADAIRAYCGDATEVFVCGGGAHNTFVLELLSARLPYTTVTTTDDLGLSPDWVEAVAFAWLAHRTLCGASGNLPAVTGARGGRVLGAVYPP